MHLIGEVRGLLDTGLGMWPVALREQCEKRGVESMTSGQTGPAIDGRIRICLGHIRWSRVEFGRRPCWRSCNHLHGAGTVGRISGIVLQAVTCGARPKNEAQTLLSSIGAQPGAQTRV